MIVEDASRTKRSLQVSLSDWISGLRPVLWNEYAYMIVPRTHFDIIYSSEIKGKSVRHPDYGEQVAFRIITSKGPIEILGAESVLTSAFFDTYNLIEMNVEREGTSVRVTYKQKVRHYRSLI
ncbi:MAG: hypothetical protein WBQ86_10620 [Candidatus Binatus sp.]